MSRRLTSTVGSRRLAGWQTLIRLLDSLPEDQRAEAWRNLWQSLGDVETRQMLAETLGDGWLWPSAAIRTAQRQQQES